MDERKKIIGRVLVGITMLLTIAQTFSISYFLLFNETKLLSFDSEISANGDTKEVPLRNLDIADISHTYLIFFISITSLALMFLSLISHFLSDYNQNQKKNIVICLILIATTTILLYIQTYLWVSVLYRLDTFTLFRGSVVRSVTIMDTLYTVTFHENESDYSEVIAGTLLSFINFFLAVCLFIFHYSFTSTMEGPTISEFVSEWTNAALDKGAVSYNYIESLISSKKVIKVRQRGERFYREIELEKDSIKCLRDKIGDSFEILNPDEINILYDDILITSDDDVKQIPSFSNLEFY